MTPDEVIAQARETADRFVRLAAELERAQAQAALAGELQVALAAAERRVGRVLGLHQVADWDSQYCAECIDARGNPLPYPCPTVRALEGDA